MVMPLFWQPKPLLVALLLWTWTLAAPVVTQPHTMFSAPRSGQDRDKVPDRSTSGPARDDADGGSLPSWIFWEDRRAWLFTPERVVSRGWLIYGYPKPKANRLLFFPEHLILEKKWSTSKNVCKIKINWCLIEYVHNVTSCQLVKFNSSQLLWSYM